MLASDRRHYRNFTGCGNTLNSGHPVVQDYVLSCLRYWVSEMHVDGFRFDLASALAPRRRGGVCCPIRPSSKASPKIRFYAT